MQLQCTPFPPPFLHNPLNSMHLEVTVYPPHIFTAPLSLMTLVCIQLGSQHPSKHTLITRLWRKEVFGMSGGGQWLVQIQPQTLILFPLAMRPLPHPTPTPTLPSSRCRYFFIGWSFHLQPSQSRFSPTVCTAQWLPLLTQPTRTLLTLAVTTRESVFFSPKLHSWRWIIEQNMVPRVRICGFWPKKNDRIDENFFLGGLERWSSVSQVNGIFVWQIPVAGWFLSVLLVFCLFARFNPL